MKKVLIMGEIDLSLESDGVTQKTMSQAAAFEAMGAAVDCIGYEGAEIALRSFSQGKYKTNDCLGTVYNQKLKRFPIWIAIRKYLINHKYDVAYIRYPIIDFVVFHALKQIRKSCDKVIIEIPSYPLEIEKANLKRKALYCIDSILHKKCVYLVDEIFYVGNKSLKIFGCDAIQIPNGIPEKIKELESTGYSFGNGIINLICVSNMHPFHGYDRLLKGLAKYYSDGEKKQIVTVTMVGNGSCRADYEKIVTDNNITKYVRFTGTLKGEKLTEEYRKASLGISSLGMYRERFEEASSLKTKEYLVRGLPFVYAVNEIGFDESFPYALKLENNSSPVSIDEIVAFANRIKQLEPQKVVSEMRDYAILHYSWESIMRSACASILDSTEYE